MRIRDRLAEAAASFIEGAALMDPYAALALADTAEQRPPGHRAPAPAGPVRSAPTAWIAGSAIVPPLYRPVPAR
jgi:hypothetical protein